MAEPTFADRVGNCLYGENGHYRPYTDNLNENKFWKRVQENHSMRKVCLELAGPNSNNTEEIRKEHEQIDLSNAIKFLIKQPFFACMSKTLIATPHDFSPKQEKILVRLRENVRSEPSGTSIGASFGVIAGIVVNTLFAYRINSLLCAIGILLGPTGIGAGLVFILIGNLIWSLQKMSLVK